MARRRNIFDFASKELSATAFWAWILDAEHSNDIALRTVNSDLRLKLNVPIDAVLESIELEKNPDDPGLKPHTPAEVDKHSGRKRIDILATYRLAAGGLLHYVIENKVRRDPNSIEQVIGYRERLQKRVIGSVHAALFTFDDALASSKMAADRSIAVFTLSEMVAVLGKHSASNATLGDYHNFLKDKVTIAKASPVRGASESHPENLARWSVVATQQGIQPLLETYVACAENYGYSVRHSKNRSIFLTIVNKSPVISVHPSKSSATNGLWLGVSITNLSRAHNISFGRPEMPSSFTWQEERQSGNEWRFGYLRIDEIEPILRTISGAIIRQ